MEWIIQLYGSFDYINNGIHFHPDTTIVPKSSLEVELEDGCKYQSPLWIVDPVRYGLFFDYVLSEEYFL